MARTVRIIKDVRRCQFTVGRVLSAFVGVAGLLATVACESKSEEKIAATVTVAPHDSLQPRKTIFVSKADSLAKAILPILNGVWVDIRYWEGLKRLKSQYKNDRNWNELSLTAMVVDAKSRIADTVRANAVTNNHEGMPLNVILTVGNDAHSLPAKLLIDQNGESSQLRYDIAGTDTLLELTRFNRQHRPIEHARFRKIAGLRFSNDKLEEGLANITNQLLFAGRYQMMDSTGKHSSVTLTEDGRIIGLPIYRNYYGQNDFIGPYSNLDYIILNRRQSDEKQLAYQIHADTLRLYGVREDTTTLTLVREKLRYTLVRQ